jgi:uncharacterized protein YecT (DUF1311 family)
MMHRMPSLHLLRFVGRHLRLPIGLILTVMQGQPSTGAEVVKPEGSSPTKAGGKCEKAPTEIDRMICLEPSLSGLDAALGRALRDYLDQAARPADREARAADQRLWLDGRATACPTGQPQSGATPGNDGTEGAVACLSRIYEQRVAVLRYERNAAAWPRIRFRPTIVEGSGIKLCEDIERDLVASFLGRGRFLNPLGEREIGFASVPGLGDDPAVRRADIDAYNLGKPFPVLQWISDSGSARLPTIEYRAFDSPKELLGAIGRGVEPLAHSVREAAHPVVDIDRLPHADTPKQQQTHPRAAFAGARSLSIDEMPRFFRYEEHIYLAAPMQPIPGKPGDLGVYRLYGPAQLHRICLFDARMPMARLPDHALTLPEIGALVRAAGPLLPAGRLCAGVGEEARTLGDHAAWRPWVLDRDRSSASGSSLGPIALYMRNRALTGAEAARQYRAYLAARAIAIEALAPFYRDEFGRSPAEARRYATLYLDRKISDGFELDPDDDVAGSLFATDYADKHAVQKLALTGKTEPLRDALGPEPRAVAKGITGDLDEPLVSDAVEHSETLHALLDLGLDPNQAGASGRSPLMVAARLDLVEAAGLLLAYGAVINARAKDAVAQTDSSGDPACMTGDKASGDTPGRTALSYAAELGSPAMVRLLLDHGADAKIADSAGRSPAEYARNRSSEPERAAEIVQMLK